MKSLFCVLFAFLATSNSLAAPTHCSQLTHADDDSSSNTAFNPVPVAPIRTASTAKDQAPYVAKMLASAPHLLKTGLSVTPLLKNWRDLVWSTAKQNAFQHHNTQVEHASSVDLDCFCIGGDVCCRTATGLDCSAGYCGI